MDSVQADRLKRLAPRWTLDAANALTRTFALATAADRPFPDFLIIGTKRGGTTSLFNYLVRHPGILGMYPRARSKKSTDYYFADRQQSQRWYRSHFHSKTYKHILSRKLHYRPLSFEASPYYVWDPRIAARISREAPSTKAILLLRDPVKRAWSHYQERVQNGVEPLSFPDALEAEEDRLDGELDQMVTQPTYHSTSWDWYSYRARGEYLWQIQNWTNHLPRENLLILFSENLYTNTQATVDEVCSFLSLPTFEMPTTRTYNATWRTLESIPKAERDVLRRHFRPHDYQLTNYLGEELPWAHNRA